MRSPRRATKRASAVHGDSTVVFKVNVSTSLDGKSQVSKKKNEVGPKNVEQKRLKIFWSTAANLTLVDRFSCNHPGREVPGQSRFFWPIPTTTGFFDSGARNFLLHRKPRSTLHPKACSCESGGGSRRRKVRPLPSPVFSSMCLSELPKKETTQIFNTQNRVFLHFFGTWIFFLFGFTVKIPQNTTISTKGHFLPPEFSPMHSRVCFFRTCREARILRL